MDRWIAFLRAINTGNRRVTGARLVEIFADLGFEAVTSYQTSGNMLFSAASPDVVAIEQSLEAGLGYEVPTVLRSERSVREIASTMPFTDVELDASQRRVQFIFLRNASSPENLHGALSGAPAEDLLRSRDRDVYWLPRAAISDSALDLGSMERRLGPMTLRTLGTVQRLVKRL